MADSVLVVNEERRLHYAGWKVVLAAFFGVMVSFAAMVPYTFSLFLAPLHAAFGWKREAISMAFGITAMAVAVCSPAIGHLLDRYPPRRIILPAIVVFAGAMAWLSLLTSQVWHFYLVYLVLGVVGNATAQLAYSRAVSTWFNERRGLAFALMLTGGGVGSILLPMLAQHMIGNYGWRSAYVALGVVALVVGLPMTAVFIRERPQVESKRVNTVAKTGMNVGEALRSRILWILLACILLSSVTANGAVAHLSAILADHGVSNGSAALALSIMGACGILGRLVTGYLMDRLFAPRVSMFMLVMCAGALVLLAYAHSAWVGIFAAAMLGFGMGSEADVTPYLLARYCGLKDFSLLYGITWTAYAVGGAIGPVITGHAFDAVHSYESSFIAMLGLPSLIAALLTLGLPRYTMPVLHSSQTDTNVLCSTMIEELQEN